MQRPLSEQLRPLTLNGFYGQAHLLEKGNLIPSLLREKKALSLLFWGPPGCGKTTLARIYMNSFPAHSFHFHPASHGMADLKKWVEQIQDKPLLYINSLLFIDEIHRLNKTAQDALLPYVEDGTFTLIGATTENPSFSLTNALLSRLRVVSLRPLEPSALEEILNKALAKTRLSELPSEVKYFLIDDCKGDARHLLNNVENLLSHNFEEILDIEKAALLLSKKIPSYDKAGDHHFQLISALHKSVRGSDPDAALYWLSRMLQGGEDPHYLARRLVRMAVEDIGLADPQAQQVALNAWQIYERLGSPEGDLALAEATLFLALSPKSNAAYKAFTKSRECAAKTSHLPPPLTMVNAPTSFMKEQGYGHNYLYDHDSPNACSGQNHFPNDLERTSFYQPEERGTEREMKKRKEYFDKIRNR